MSMLLQELAFESTRKIEWDQDAAYRRALREVIDNVLDDYLGDDPDVLALGADEHRRLNLALKQGEGKVSHWADHLTEVAPDLLRRVQTCCEAKTGRIQFYIEDEWDEVLESLQVALADVGGSHWLVQGRNLGWLHRSGHKLVDTDDAQKLLQEILPTADCHFIIFVHPGHLAMLCSHHDAPTGERYWIIPRNKDPDGKSQEDSPGQSLAE